MVSESTRALCQIIERRPFLTLTDDELELIVTGLTGEALRQRADNSLKYNRLAEVVWQELKQRRADFRSLREGNFLAPQRCPSFASILGQPFRPILCEGVDGHDGLHFSTSKHGQRKEWR